MYGSSLRMETVRPRALRIRPMLAAVIPFPSEEVTPPVTKTYFDIGRAPPGGFSNATENDPQRQGRSGSGRRLEAGLDAVCQRLGVGRRVPPWIVAGRSTGSPPAGST